jgi:hypothetical protein
MRGSTQCACCVIEIAGSQLAEVQVHETWREQAAQRDRPAPKAAWVRVAPRFGRLR